MGLFQSKAEEEPNITEQRYDGCDNQEYEIENQYQKVEDQIFHEVQVRNAKQSQIIQKHLCVLNQTHDCLGKNIIALCVNFYYSPQKMPIDQSRNYSCALKDLFPDMKNHGSIIQGMIFLPRVLLDKYYIIMIDKNQDIFRVSVEGLSDHQAQLSLGLGQLLQIRDPQLTLGDDGYPIIKITNPYEIIPYDVDHNLYWMQLQIIKEKCQYNFQASYLLKNFISSIKILCQEAPLFKNRDQLQKEVSNLKDNNINDYLQFLTAQTMAQYNTDAAINIYQELIMNLKGQYSFIYYFMMLLYYQRGDYLSSIDNGNEYIRICGIENTVEEDGYANALYIMGCNYRVMLDKRQCEYYFLEAIKIQPNNSRFLSSLGCYYFSQFQYRIALETLQKSISQRHQCLCIYQQRCHFIFLCYFHLKNIKKFVRQAYLLYQLNSQNIIAISEGTQNLILSSYFTLEEKQKFIKYLNNYCAFQNISNHLSDLYMRYNLQKSDEDSPEDCYNESTKSKKDQFQQSFYKNDNHYDQSNNDKKKRQNQQQQDKEETFQNISELVFNKKKSKKKKVFKKKQKSKINSKINKVAEKQLIQKSQIISKIDKEEKQLIVSKQPDQGLVAQIDIRGKNRVFKIIFDPLLNFDDVYMLKKFRNASQKLSKRQKSASGIKYIQEADLYEVKICGKNGFNGKRLFCEKPNQVGNLMTLKFDQLLTHREADRRISQKKASQ